MFYPILVYVFSLNVFATMNFVVSFTYKVIFPKFSFSFLFICINNHSYTDIAEVTQHIHVDKTISSSSFFCQVPDIFIFVLL